MCIMLLACLACTPLIAGNYDKGVSLFSENKPAEAIIYLLRMIGTAIIEPGTVPLVFLFTERITKRR